MKRLFALPALALVIAAALVPTLCRSAPAENAEMAQLVVEARADHGIDGLRSEPRGLPAPSAPIDWKYVAVRDTERRFRTLELLRSGELHAAADYMNAAQILLHGESTEDQRLAFSLATLASRLDPNDGDAKWLSAAAWDKLLVTMGRPQWYGTQSTNRTASGRWELSPVDESITDEQRKELNVPPLADAKAALAQLNR